MKKILLILITFLTLAKPVMASDMATSYKLDDSAAQTGDIIVNENGKFVRSTTEYDLRIFGVVTDTATIIMRSLDPAFKPVVQTGTTLVNVIDNVKKGDYVTTSKTPGKGQKATVSGYVLGTALAAGPGLIPVAVKIEYAEISNARTLSRLVNYMTMDLFKNIRDQGQTSMVMRYLVSGLIMLLSLALAGFTVSRSVPKAIEAVGRNPLAKTSIMFSLVFSIGLAILTLGLGLVITIVILKI